MPLIVDKEQKIKEICTKAYQEFLITGIEKFSLNQFIASSGISKGQFYHYFKTKEELVYEVMSFVTLQHLEQIGKVIDQATTPYAMLTTLFAFYLSKEQEAKDLRTLIFDALHIYTHSNEPKIRAHNKEVYDWIDEKLFEIFSEYNLSESIIKSISTTADGYYIRSLMIDGYDLQKELDAYFLSIIQLISPKGFS